MSRDPTAPPERELTATERRMLVHKPDAKDVYMARRSRVEHRRLVRGEGEHEKNRRRRYAGKLTTRQDVMGIVELYNREKILPLALRLDMAEGALRYLTAPMWQRRWWDLKRWGGQVVTWLEKKGIRLYTLYTRSEDISPVAEGARNEADSHD